jgi:hypothetical protein
VDLLRHIDGILARNGARISQLQVRQASSPNGMTSQATTTTQLKGQPQVSLRLLMVGLWLLEAIDFAQVNDVYIFVLHELHELNLAASEGFSWNYSSY